jgi:hypothetical protein
MQGLRERGDMCFVTRALIFMGSPRVADEQVLKQFVQWVHTLRGKTLNALIDKEDSPRRSPKEPSQLREFENPLLVERSVELDDRSRASFLVKSRSRRPHHQELDFSAGKQTRFSNLLTRRPIRDIQTQTLWGGCDMLNKMGYWWVPAGSFAIALCLSTIAGPSMHMKVKANITATGPATAVTTISVGEAITSFDNNGPGKSRGITAGGHGNRDDIDDFAAELLKPPKGKAVFDPKKTMGQAFPMIQPPPVLTNICSLETQFNFWGKTVSGVVKAKVKTVRMGFNETPTGEVVTGPASNGGSVAGKVSDHGSLPGLRYTYTWETSQEPNLYFLPLLVVELPLTEMDAGAVGSFNTTPPTLPTAKDAVAHE